MLDKQPPEGINIFISDSPGDFIDWVQGTFQKPFGVFNTQALKIGKGGFAGGGFEPAFEMPGADPDEFGHFINGKFAFIVFPHPLLCLLDLFVRMIFPEIVDNIG